MRGSRDWSWMRAAARLAGCSLIVRPANVCRPDRGELPGTDALGMRLGVTAADLTARATGPDPAGPALGLHPPCAIVDIDRDGKGLAHRLAEIKSARETDFLASHRALKAEVAIGDFDDPGIRVMVKSDAHALTQLK